jgi:hypothetical protein
MTEHKTRPGKIARLPHDIREKLEKLNTPNPL